MNNRVKDALEYCLRAIQDGAGVEAVLARYPEMAAELRPLLEAAQRARQLKGPAPTEAVIQRTRARLMQQAMQIQPKRRAAVLPLAQRLAFSLLMALVLLLSGTGLVRASTMTLPGDNLYPVKRTWEGVRLQFFVNPGRREALESEYEQERLDEVAELLQKGRLVPITFSGLITAQTPGQIVVSGVPVTISGQTQLSGAALVIGSAVIVTGTTDSLGQVAALEIRVLPSGSLVPVAEARGSGSKGGGNDRHSSTFHLEGTVDSIQGNVLVVDGRSVIVDPALLPVLVPGDMVEVKGYFTAEGQFYATEVELEEPDSEDLNGKPETEEKQPDPTGDGSMLEEDHSDEDHSDGDHSEDEHHEEDKDTHTPEETPESGH